MNTATASPASAPSPEPICGCQCGKVRSVAAFAGDRVDVHVVLAAHDAKDCKIHTVRVTVPTHRGAMTTQGWRYVQVEVAAALGEIEKKLVVR